MKNLSRAEKALAVSENDPQPPRFVIFGTRVDGAFELQDVIVDALAARGVPSDRVEAVREIRNIEPAFFDLPPQGQPVIGSKPRPLRRLGALVNHLRPSTPAIRRINLPTAVFVFPQMRDHYEDGVVGISADTPYDIIEGLCAEYDVPIVYVERHTTPAELAQGIGQLATIDTDRQA